MAGKKWNSRDEAVRVAEALEAHDRLDTERFNSLHATLDEIKADVKSLLNSRAYSSGKSKGLMIAASAVSAAVAMLWKIAEAYIK